MSSASQILQSNGAEVYKLTMSSENRKIGLYFITLVALVAATLVTGNKKDEEETSLYKVLFYILLTSTITVSVLSFISLGRLRLRP